MHMSLMRLKRKIKKLQPHPSAIRQTPSPSKGKALIENIFTKIYHSLKQGVKHKKTRLQIQPGFSF